MFEEFLMDKDEIRKKIQNENEKKMKIISKSELQLLKKKRKKEKIYWKNIIGQKIH